MGLKVLGVELAAQTIKLALVKNERKPKVLASDILPMPSGAWANDTLLDGKSVARAIQNATLANKIMAQAEAVSLYIGTPQTVVRPIRLPVLNEKEIRPAIEFELSQSFPGIAKTHAISYKEYGRAKDGMWGIVSFSPTRALEAYKEVVEALPYKKAVFDAAANCEAKAYTAFCRQSKESKAVMLLNVSLFGSRFTVLEKGQIRYSRFVGEGDAQLIEALCEKLSVSRDAFLLQRGKDKPDALKTALVDKSLYTRYMGTLAEQTRQTLEFYAMGEGKSLLPVSELVLLGDSALYPHFAEYLHSSVSIPVYGAESAAGAVEGERFMRLMAAMGAALREG